MDIVLRNPAALGLLALAVPIVLLYLRRRRAPPCEAAPAAIWSRVLAARPGWSRWLAMRDRVSSTAQLFALALIALAAAEPADGGPVCTALILIAAALLSVEGWAFHRRWTN
jgi:hypothetical protein